MKSGAAERAAVERMLRSARAWIFDFDGTLVDSNAVKRRAFEYCFKGLKRRRKEVLAYCAANPHITRTEKFRHVYEEILGQPYTRNTERDLHRRFEAATTRPIIKAAEIPGAKAFLEKGCKEHLCGILSTTPHGILVGILEKRDWDRFFGVIRGAPVRKADWLREFRRKHRLKPSEVIYFGDNPEDAQAASAAGCRFIGLRDRRLRKKGIAHWNDFKGILAS